MKRIKLVSLFSIHQSIIHPRTHVQIMGKNSGRPYKGQLVQSLRVAGLHDLDDVPQNHQNQKPGGPSSQNSTFLHPTATLLWLLSKHLC